MPNIKVKHLLISAAFISTVIGLFSYEVSKAGLVINPTPSMPGYLYVINNDTSPVSVGDIVLLCPSFEQMKAVFDLPTVTKLGGGSCHGLPPLIKQVVATGGDEVVIASDAITIVGKGAVINSAQYDMSTLKPVKIKERAFKLNSSEILVIGVGSKYSYDSRYFGPVSIKNVMTKLSRLL